MSDVPRLKIWTLTSLFPNAEQPNHGVFVANRLAHLVRTKPVQARVIAPIAQMPKFFGWNPYADLADVPATARRDGMEVAHPRYAMIPKIGMPVQPYLYYRALRTWFADAMARDGAPDLIDAHYVYPDGVAAALLARDFDLPLMITARGTDINLIPRYRLPRRWIQWALKRADQLVGVCQALSDEMMGLGADPAKVTTLRNGVDLELFAPADRMKIRDELGLRGPVLLAVGALIARKGQALVIEALANLPDHTLLLAGDGPDLARLQTLVQRLRLDHRVRFLGPVPHRDLPVIYNAADVSVLASAREGWANVLLESMACGTPVVASDVWGMPEVVAAPAAGQLLADRTPAAIAAGIRTVEDRGIDRAATRRYAEGFSWDATSAGQYRIMCRLARHRQRS